MQKRRAPVGAYPGGRRHRGVERCRKVGAVGFEVLEPLPMTVGSGDPSPRRLGADSNPVVFADEQQRHGQTLIRRMHRRVDGAERRRVVDRGVTETAHRHRVVGPRAGHPEFARPSDRERNAEGAWEVGGDGRGLRNDVQVVAAENLVPPACDRFLGGRHQPQQDVAQRVTSGTCRARARKKPPDR